MENAGEVTQQADFVLREQLGSKFASMTSAPEFVQLAQDLAPESSKKVSSYISTSEMVLEPGITGADARNGCVVEALVVKDQVAEEGFSAEEPLTIEAASGDSLDPIFNSSLNSSPLLRKSPTSSSSESSGKKVIY